MHVFVFTAQLVLLAAGVLCRLSATATATVTVTGTEVEGNYWQTLESFNTTTTSSWGLNGSMTFASTTSTNAGTENTTSTGTASEPAPTPPSTTRLDNRSGDNPSYISVSDPNDAQDWQTDSTTITTTGTICTEGAAAKSSEKTTTEEPFAFSWLFNTTSTNTTTETTSSSTGTNLHSSLWTTNWTISTFTTSLTATSTATGPSITNTLAATVPSTQTSTSSPTSTVAGTSSASTSTATGTSFSTTTTGTSSITTTSTSTSSHTSTSSSSSSSSATRTISSSSSSSSTGTGTSTSTSVNSAAAATTSTFAGSTSTSTSTSTTTSTTSTPSISSSSSTTTASSTETRSSSSPTTTTTSSSSPTFSQTVSTAANTSTRPAGATTTTSSASSSYSTTTTTTTTSSASSSYSTTTTTSLTATVSSTTTRPGTATSTSPTRTATLASTTGTQTNTSSTSTSTSNFTGTTTLSTHSLTAPTHTITGTTQSEEATLATNVSWTTTFVNASLNFSATSPTTSLAIMPTTRQHVVATPTTSGANSQSGSTSTTREFAPNSTASTSTSASAAMTSSANTTTWTTTFTYSARPESSYGVTVTSSTTTSTETLVPSTPPVEEFNFTTSMVVDTFTDVPASPGKIALRTALLNLDYDSLVADYAMLLQVMTILKEEIALKSGDGVTGDHVQVSLSPGSISVQATIIPPPGASTTTILDRLDTPTNLSLVIVSRIAQIPDIELVATGPIGMSDIVSSFVLPVAAETTTTMTSATSATTVTASTTTTRTSERSCREDMCPAGYRAKVGFHASACSSSGCSIVECCDQEARSQVTACQHPVGSLGQGVICPKASGTGFLLYSQDSIHDRFQDAAFDTSDADHFVCARRTSETWQYFVLGEWRAFHPLHGDILVVSVDFDRATVQSLAGVHGEVHGVLQGFAFGDLEFMESGVQDDANSLRVVIAGTSFWTACPGAGRLPGDWLVGAWGDCSAICGRGLRVRTVGCWRTPQADGCAEAEPPSNEECEVSGGCSVHSPEEVTGMPGIVLAVVASGTALCCLSLCILAACWCRRRCSSEGRELGVVIRPDGTWFEETAAGTRLRFNPEEFEVESSLDEDPRKPETPPERSISLRDNLFSTGAACGPPKVMHIVCSSGQDLCEGTYRLVQEMKANGMPLWRQEAGSHWLYSGINGRWCIGGSDVKEREFACAAGYICRMEPHEGLLPHRISGPWAQWNGTRFIEDLAIRVWAPPHCMASHPGLFADIGSISI